MKDIGVDVYSRGLRYLGGHASHFVSEDALLLWVIEEGGFQGVVENPLVVFLLDGWVSNTPYICSSQVGDSGYPAACTRRSSA